VPGCAFVKISYWLQNRLLFLRSEIECYENKIFWLNSLTGRKSKLCHLHAVVFCQEIFFRMPSVTTKFMLYTHYAFQLKFTIRCTECATSFQNVGINVTLRDTAYDGLYTSYTIYFHSLVTYSSLHGHMH
jgi:hypothetical protein